MSGQTNITQKYWQDMAAGVRYIRKHAYIGRFFLYITILFFMITPVSTLAPLQVTRRFGDDIWRLTAIEVVFSIGMLAGGLLIASWRGFRNRIKTIALATLIIGAMTILLGVVLNFKFLPGISKGLQGWPCRFIVRRRRFCCRKKLNPITGGWFGVMSMIASGVMPTAMFIFGPHDRIRIEWLFIGSGVLLTLMSGCLTANKILVKPANRPMLP